MTGSFTDYGEDYLSETLGNNHGEFGFGIYFSQLNETTLFTINQNGSSIHVYDLQSVTYRNLGVAIPINVKYYGCLSSSEIPTPKLYITGGYNDSVLNDLQILNLEDNTWMEWVNNTYSMIKPRHGHGCIVVNDELWAIGGYHQESIEVINISNIIYQSWNEIGNLSCNLARPGVTKMDDLIFIVGGKCQDTLTNSDTLYIIDTVASRVSSIISIYAGNLPFGVNGVAVVAIDYTIYGFGGESDDNLDSWMTLDSWWTVDPTSDPTDLPTFDPTSHPTEEPSQPTMNPTVSPTAAPTTIDHYQLCINDRTTCQVWKNEVKCWGEKTFNDPSYDGTNGGYVYTPQIGGYDLGDADGDFNASYVRCGKEFTCAVSTEGKARCWGMFVLMHSIVGCCVGFVLCASLLPCWLLTSD